MKRVVYLSILIILLTIYPISATVHLPPSITRPDDITYVVGTTGNEISWTAEATESGDSPGVYIVTRDGEILADHNEVAWQDNVPIVVNIDGLDVGDYTYIIEVRDSGYPTYADAATDTVEITVIEETTNTSSTATSNGQTTPTDTGDVTTNTDETSFFPFLFGVFMIAIITLIRKIRYFN